MQGCCGDKYNSPTAVHGSVVSSVVPQVWCHSCAWQCGVKCGATSFKCGATSVVPQALSVAPQVWCHSCAWQCGVKCGAICCVSM